MNCCPWAQRRPTAVETSLEAIKPPARTTTLPGVLCAGLIPQPRHFLKHLSYRPTTYLHLLTSNQYPHGRNPSASLHRVSWHLKASPGRSPDYHLDLWDCLCTLIFWEGQTTHRHNSR